MIKKNSICRINSIKHYKNHRKNPENKHHEKNTENFRSLIAIVYAFLPVFACIKIVHADTNIEASTAFENGKQAYDDERFIEAADEFRRAYTLRPTWRLLYNIGQAEAAGKRYGPALEAFERYLAEGGDDIERERQSQIITENTRLRGIVGFAKILSPPGAVIYIDGVARGEAPFTRELPVAASVSHTIRMVMNGRRVEKQFQVNVGRTVSISVFPKSNADSSSTEVNLDEGESPVNKTAVTDSTGSLRRPLAWSYIGVGASLVVGGCISGGLALNKNADVKEKCSDHICYDDDYELLSTRNRLATTSSVLLAVGGIATLVGGVLLLLDRRHSTEVSLTVVSIPGTLMIEGKF